MQALLTIYLAGVLIGLWRTDGSVGTKAALALLWPIGPLAFAVTVTGLLAAGVVALLAGRLSTGRVSSR